MARIRVFLLTYRRPRLLGRALASLRAQTFNDWICELHNDDPADSYPAQLVAATADPRILLHSHPQNWGPVASFNHAYAGGPEPFATVLEDDNWWEPDFLASAVGQLESHAEAALVWTNMRLWQESSAGHWLDTGRMIWPASPHAPGCQQFTWPEVFQSIEALHSQGAMVFRPSAFSIHGVPPSTPLAIIEHLRERAARGTLLLLRRPLANFALTLSTSRGADRDLWLQSKLLVAASFFAANDLPAEMLKRLWASRRAARPRDTGLLFFASFALCRPSLLRPAEWRDALTFVLGCIRHPLSAWRGLRFRAHHPEVWQWLLTHTRTSAPQCSLLAK